ncbi:MAG: saccharopine dehydrogenase NADP-binding domain-containing protein [Bacteroidetes bacterium]|nr:saccharopine dehydrogenase NADP-binding domain-containing protein [Bacteroidota bacterium]
MKTILLLGAGKSATVLIDFLLQEVQQHGWQLVVADADRELVLSKTHHSPFAEAVQLDIKKETERTALISKADVVISMMPPDLHVLVAQDCLVLGKHLLTASYVDKAIKELENDIAAKDLLFLCEMGLDPGIDHMSAMQMIDAIKIKGGRITAFKSHCGGLVAPESDNNPWHYKISWNPRNIVLAGSAGAVYKEHGQVTEAPYYAIFENAKTVEVPGLGELAYYPNRDSLGYMPLYHLEDAATFIRTTLRYPAFCRGWDYIVNLGLTDTDDHDNIMDCETYADWLERKLYMVEDAEMSFDEYMDLYVADEYHTELKSQFTFLGLLAQQKLPKAAQCSADILQFIAEQKLAMQPADKDMIVMLHELEYELQNNTHTVQSWLTVTGTDNLHTAMAKTVGLPLGIAASLLLQGKIALTGLHIPTVKEIYEPVLAALQQQGISFEEKST